ncbi:MAG: bifunctional oligoribonuclease/PAP phosphatase NrnA [Anaerolineae bacterium]|nr:bifunctional oligoribonuclease/PAP phosphatase NrnA [Anaerolineae bacterium]
MSDLHQTIRELFENSQNIVIVSHIRPDGDCVGSVLGLGMALIEKGKNVQMILRDGVPSSFKHLPGSDLVIRKPNAPYDLSIVVDCSDLIRTGGVLDGARPVLNIDHHITNLNFADINFVEAESAATAAILTKYLQQWGLSITESVARNLATGIISDTLGFRTSNVTPETLRLTANLMDTGIRLDDLYFQALVQRSIDSLNYWGKGINNIQRDGRLIWTTLTMKDRKEAGYTGNDDADFINILSGVQDFDIAVIFVEQSGKRVKVSWRAKAGWNVSQIALQFGGGGHPAAAGAELSGKLEDIQTQVLSATSLILTNQANDNKQERDASSTNGFGDR